MTITKRKTLVIARYRENLAWLCRVPEDFQIVIYDKNESPVGVKIHREIQHRCSVIRVPNIGREPHTYLKFIIDNYDDLPDIIVMCQGDPFPHAPEFISALYEISDAPYQPLTIQYMPNTIHDDMAKMYKQHKYYRIERISTYTLAPIHFFDCGIPPLCDSYLNYYNLPKGENVMLHHLHQAGIFDLLPKDAELINFSYSAIFSVSKEAILQHSKGLYERLMEKTCRPGWFECSIMERTWHLLFDSKSAFTPI